MKIGVVGSRRRNDESEKALIWIHLQEIQKQIGCEKIILVSGGCPKGADRMAEELAREHSIPMYIYKPLYPKPCTYYAACKALKDRNTRIAEESDILIALPASDRTGGTEDTISKAQKLSKRILLI